MPLYEFRCTKCGHEFEQIVFPSDNEPMKCPRCRARKPERLLSIFSSSTTGTRAGGSVSSSCTTPSRGFS